VVEALAAKAAATEVVAAEARTAMKVAAAEITVAAVEAIVEAGRC
jgi:hypothetical protein